MAEKRRTSFMDVPKLHNPHQVIMISCKWLSIKDVEIFWPFLIPPPPCRNSDPNLPNFYLLIYCNIGISVPPLPLKYSDVF